MAGWIKRIIFLLLVLFCQSNPSWLKVIGGGGGGPCDFSVSPSPFGLDFGTLDFGTSDSGLTIIFDKQGKLRGQSRSGRAPRLDSQAAQEEAAVTASQAAQVMSAESFILKEIFVVSTVHSAFASFHTSQPLFQFRDSERRILYR